MARSTAKFISYDLRPAKQAERRMLIDFLKCASDGGMKVSDCRYVGMGGFRFYDFLLIHRYVGIRSMVSLEHDGKLFPRCEFNSPYDFIEIRNETCEEFLRTDIGGKRSIYWLDYDSGITSAVADDLVALGDKLAAGEMVFATVASDVPQDMKSLNEQERLDRLREDFGDFALDVQLEDLSNAAFSDAVSTILEAVFRNAFSARTDGRFYPRFNVTYKDTVRMITIGGYFCAPEQDAVIRERLLKDMPFLSNARYDIRSFNISDAERRLFDLAATKSRKDSKEARALARLGFRPTELESYRELLRFIPRYFETAL